MRGRADRGESLIELLVAVLIMSTAVVAVVGGLATAVLMSDVHRKQAALGAYIRAYATTMEGAVAKSPTGYVACASITSYPAYNPGTGYDAEITAVSYWDGSTFGISCTPSTDWGVQRLSLRVWSTDGRAEERLDVVIRKPCRATDAACS